MSRLGGPSWEGLLLAVALLAVPFPRISALQGAPPPLQGALMIGVRTLGTEVWDEAKASGAEKEILQMVGDTLLRMDPATRELRPGLVESWQVSSDGRTWTFSLRADIRFHDGWGPLTAEDVKFTWARVISKESVALGAGILREAVNGNMENFEIVNARQFRIRTPSIQIDLPLNLSNGVLQAFTIQSRRYFGAVGEERAVTHPVGTGPFRLASHVRGQQVTLEAVASHWRQTPGFKTVVVRIIREEAAMLAELQSSTLDLAPLSVSLKREAQRAGLHSSSVPSTANAYVVFGGMSPGHQNYDRNAPWIQAENPAKGRLVREALTLAIARRAIVERILSGEGQPAGAPFSFIPGPFRFNDPNWKVPPYDPARAKRLLAEGGYPSGFTMDMPIYPLAGRPEVEDIAHAVADMYEMIGIRVNRIPMEYRPTFRARLAARATKGMVFVNANTFYDEPAAFFRVAGAPEATLAFIHDARVSATVKSLSGELDTEKRMALARELGNYIVRERLAAPIASMSGMWIMGKKVGKVQFITSMATLNSVEYITPAR